MNVFSILACSPDNTPYRAPLWLSSGLSKYNVTQVTILSLTSAFFSYIIFVYADFIHRPNIPQH